MPVWVDVVDRVNKVDKDLKVFSHFLYQLILVRGYSLNAKGAKVRKEYAKNSYANFANSLRSLRLNIEASLSKAAYIIRNRNPGNPVDPFNLG